MSQQALSGKSLIGENISYIRNYKGFTLEELASATGLAPTFLKGLENGTVRPPSYHILTILSKALQVDVSILINQEVEQQEPIKSIYEHILWGDFSINDRIATRESKEALVALIKEITESYVGSDLAIKQSILIAEKVEQFLKTIR